MSYLNHFLFQDANDIIATLKSHLCMRYHHNPHVKKFPTLLSLHLYTRARLVIEELPQVSHKCALKRIMNDRKAVNTKCVHLMQLISRHNNQSVVHKIYK